MKNSPLAQVKETFESKENLVKEIKKMFDKGDLFEDGLNPDKGLLRVSNARLLRLHRVATEVTERFSTRAKMVEDLTKMLGRSKDEDLKTSFSKWGLPRLWDYYQSVSKKNAS